MIVPTIITVSLIIMTGILIHSRIKGKKSMKKMNRERFIISDAGDEMTHIYNK